MENPKGGEKMKELKTLSDNASARAHHYDALEHLLETAKYYQKLRTRTIDRAERRETLQHLVAVAHTTLDAEGGATSQTAGERVREAVLLVRQA